MGTSYIIKNAHRDGWPNGGNPGGYTNRLSLMAPDHPSWQPAWITLHTHTPLSCCGMGTIAGFDIMKTVQDMPDVDTVADLLDTLAEDQGSRMLMGIATIGQLQGWCDTWWSLAFGLERQNKEPLPNWSYQGEKRLYIVTCHPASWVRRLRDPYSDEHKAYVEFYNKHVNPTSKDAVVAQPRINILLGREPMPAQQQQKV